MPVTLDATSTEWVSLEEFKRHINYGTGNADDAEQQMILSAAHDAVEGLIGPVLWRNVEQTVDSTSGTVMLTTIPVVSVTSATSGGQTLTYTSNLSTGVLTDVTSSGSVVVDYVAGRTVVPDAIRLATLIIAAHLWRDQLGNSPSALPVDQDQPAATETFGLSVVIPPKAAELLGPYLALPGFA